MASHVDFTQYFLMKVNSNGTWIDSIVTRDLEECKKLAKLKLKDDENISEVMIREVSTKYIYHQKREEQ